MLERNRGARRDRTKQRRDFCWKKFRQYLMTWEQWGTRYNRFPTLVTEKEYINEVRRFLRNEGINYSVKNDFLCGDCGYAPKDKTSGCYCMSNKMHRTNKENDTLDADWKSWG